nr:reverse transcriptase domain-containing protein [Tanacetum cinerariifolium]
MPKFASTLKALIGNKEKLSEMAQTLMNEHYSAVILNKLPKKLGDPRKFLIPCEFPGMDECLALADLDRTESKPVDIAKDVKVKVAITYNLDQTSRYSANYDQITANKIDVTDEACEEYSQEVLSFSDVTVSDSPTPSNDPIVSTTSPALTLFRDSDFLLFEEADAFLEDDPDSPELDPSYYDPEGDILSLEVILNSDPSPPLLNHKQSVPSFKEELKACEAKTIKSSIDETPEVELKDLSLHLEYVFLEGDNKLPVIIAKALRDEEKSTLIKVLKSHKRAIAWKLSDIQGINPEFCTHKILMEEDYKLETTEVFMDDFSVFGNSFENCLSRLDKMPQRREDTKLCLNWEKSHFMVKEGIVLGHKISKNGIEVDKAKIDVIAKLPHLTVKGAVLGQRPEKHFQPIHYASKTLTDAESNYTTTEKEMFAVV